MSYKTELPNILRPRGIFHKEVSPGLDLPTWFVDSIKAIDEHLHFVWHPYEVIYDDVMNEYSGKADDPRFTIHEEYGQENWGYVLTDNVGRPKEEAFWHIWRLHEPYGWTHLVRIEAPDEPEYLVLLLNRIHLQARIKDKYGTRAWSRNMQEESDKIQEQNLREKQDLFNAFQEENSWLTEKAMENFQRGHLRPTNPQKETIMSFDKQGNRSRISRPLEDEDALIIPGR